MSHQSGNGKVKLRWLGHAAFEIESSGGTKLLIDPFIKDNPVTPEALKNLDRYKYSDRPDAICVSHSHGDHSANATEIAKLSGAPVIGMVEFVSSLDLPAKAIEGWQHRRRVSHRGCERASRARNALLRKRLSDGLRHPVR